MMKKTSKQALSLNTVLPISFYSQLRMEITNRYFKEKLDKFGWYQTYSEVSTLNIDLYEKIIAEGLLDENDILYIANDSIERFAINSFV